MDMETLLIKMDLCIKGVGLKEGSMGMEHFIQKVDYVEKGNGWMVKEWNGWVNIRQLESVDT